MTGLTTDFRFALRALAASPVFVVLAVLCLGIGIGASTLTFTVANGALRNPLGALERDGLVEVWESHESAPSQWLPVPQGRFEDWRGALASDTELAAFREASLVVGPSGSEIRADGAIATDNLFSLLGVAPLLGRGLQPSDASTGSEPVVVLSETYWRSQLGEDRNAVGRALLIGGVPHTVVGILPTLTSIGMPRQMRLARLWVPLRAESQPSSRTDRSWFVVARLPDGASAESFDAELGAVARRLADAYPQDRGFSPRVARFGDTSLSDSRTALLLAMGAAWLVLLVSTVNLANLTFAHALRRRHELAVRAAIGASPWRLARQLLCESLVVAALGATLGVFLARLGLTVVERGYESQTLAPVSLPVDWLSLAYAVALTFAATALFGWLPARQAARSATRVQIAESGAGTTGTRAGARLRRGLVVAQLAASLVLLVGAALLSKSFLNLLAQDTGVEAQRVTTLRVESTGSVGLDTAERFTDAVLGALEAVPGVEQAAATTNLLPTRGGGFRSTVALPSEVADGGVGREIAYTGVSPDFFSTLGIALLRGDASLANGSSGRVAVVNETMAELLWPNEDALGRRFRLGADAERGEITVTGIVRDVMTWDSSGERPLPIAFFDIDSFATRPLFFFVRHTGDADVVGMPTLTRAIDSLGLPVLRIVVTPMAQVARDPFWRQRLFSLWFTIFGVAAIVLTAAGIYGVLSMVVWQRAQEMGIRMALGAERIAVLWLVLREAVGFVAAGVGVGLVTAYLVASTLQSLLFGVEPFDMPLFLAAAAVLAAVALAASLAPAIRAARFDPRRLLKS